MGGTTIFGALVAALVFAGLSGKAAAQSYPAKTVTIVVPAAAGGGIDLSARWLAAELTPALGKTVVVENKGGASGILGSQQVARAEPDGHTLLVTLSGFLVTSPALFNSLPWDPVKDFAPVSMLWTSPHILVVNKDSPINTLSELIAYGRANPGKLTFGSPGLTSETHIGSEMFGQMANIKVTAGAVPRHRPGLQRSARWATWLLPQHHAAADGPIAGQRHQGPGDRQRDPSSATAEHTDDSRGRPSGA